MLETVCSAVRRLKKISNSTFQCDYYYYYYYYYYNIMLGTQHNCQRVLILSHRYDFTQEDGVQFLKLPLFRWMPSTPLGHCDSPQSMLKKLPCSKPTCFSLHSIQWEAHIFAQTFNRNKALPSESEGNKLFVQKIKYRNKKTRSTMITTKNPTFVYEEWRFRYMASFLYF